MNSFKHLGLNAPPFDRGLARVEVAAQAAGGAAAGGVGAAPRTSPASERTACAFIAVLMCVSVQKNSDVSFLRVCFFGVVSKVTLFLGS